MKNTRPDNQRPTEAPDIGALIRAPLVALIILLAILAANVATAYWAIGGYQLWLNLAFALASIVLIGVVFMDLKSEGPLNRLCAAAGFAWLAIFLLLTFGDYLTRAIAPL